MLRYLADVKRLTLGWIIQPRDTDIPNGPVFRQVAADI